MSAEAMIRAAEMRRCEALVAGDFAALGALLTDDLVHIHGNGGTDDKAAYLLGIEQKYIFHAVARGDLHVRFYGDVAVVTGPLSQTISLQGSEDRHEIEAMTTQVWVVINGRWLQTTCHNQFLQRS